MKKLILLELALLFLATTFSSDNPPGWFQQSLPVNDYINDIFFLDSLNGWVVTPNGNIMKTTNGGNNWEIQKDSAGNLFVVQFLDSMTGYVLGNGSHGIIYKTTNGGLNWDLIHDFSPAAIFRDMSFVNKNIGWVSSIDFFDGGVFKTTDGGNSWVRQLDETYNTDKIFFLNKDTGWAKYIESRLLRTTNGGDNWQTQYNFDRDIFDIDFVNENIGFIAAYRMPRTTDGGFTWNESASDEGGIKISMISDSLGWAGQEFFKIVKTLNGGRFWFSQNSPIFNNSSVVGIDSLKAWGAGNGVVHTTDGGGLSGINQHVSEISSYFILEQNYPNPFNPNTVISYELRITSFVKLCVYDIQGKEISEMVNERQAVGEYKIEFNGGDLPSGVYFYKLEIKSGKFGNVLTDTKMMVLTR